MKKTWRLNHPKQCTTCPWIKKNNTSSIPNYNREKHCNLECTISRSVGDNIVGDITFMACHKSDEGNEITCIGWLYNQLGVGNNIGLRLMARGCENLSEMEVVGEQVNSFDETFD